MNNLFKVGISLVVLGVVLTLGGGILGGFYSILASVGFGATLPVVIMILLGVTGIIAGTFMVITGYDEER